jgi:hypothetical protein
MPTPQGSNTTGPSEFYKAYAPSAVLGGDADLIADGGGPCREIIVGSAGDLVVKTPAGVSVTISGIPAGMRLPIQASKLIASGSTAYKLLVLW